MLNMDSEYKIGDKTKKFNFPPKVTTAEIVLRIQLIDDLFCYNNHSVLCVHHSGTGNMWEEEEAHPGGWCHRRVWPD